MRARALYEEKLRRVMNLRIEKSKRSFWDFCKTRAPDFYKDERWYLRLYSETLQALYDRKLTKAYFYSLAADIAPKWFMREFDWDAIPDSDEPFTKLIINMPPRHGKSRTLILFCEWSFGRDRSNKIITASYNEDMATDFSRYTRDGIAEEKNSAAEIVYSDIFPDTKIKRGDSSYRQWSLEGSHFSYKGAGLGGSVTGKGGNILIVDDPVKNAEEAYNERELDKQWRWYTGTFLSRLEEDGGRPIEIVNMTRWAKKDICGRILDGNGRNEWFVLRIEVTSKSGEMLCDDLLSKHRYEYFKKEMDEAVFWANYHQRPLDQKGKLYTSFKTYDRLPAAEDGSSLAEQVFNYSDTADGGDDYLCSIVAQEYQGYAYVVDVLYTQEGMEVTEDLAADQLHERQVNNAYIESNSGGAGYARSVSRITKQKYPTSPTVFHSFHQSKNKQARILSNSTYVMQRVLFPSDWRNRWPDYYKAMNEYQRHGKNNHDDAPDATTGIAEVLQKRIKVQEKPQGRPNRPRPTGRRGGR